LKAYRTYSDYLLTLRNGNRVLFNHDSRPLMQRDIELYRLLRPGEWAIHAITRYNRPDLMIYSQDGFEDKYKKQSWSQPCSTLVAHLSQDGHMFIHPDRRQGRSITVREAARLQSFPDDYIFAGPRTSQFRHVGNAVPPILAEAVALEIMAHLRGSSCSPSAASCLGAVQPAGRDA
jgi:DNA (cytosine-5)-methyltransferase 1